MEKIITEKLSISDNEMKVYSRTLQFIFIKAALDVLNDCKIIIEHSISKGLYGEIEKDTPLNEDDIKKIKSKMEEIIKKDISIKKIKVSKEKAIETFKSYGMTSLSI